MDFGCLPIRYAVYQIVGDLLHAKDVLMCSEYGMISYILLYELRKFVLKCFCICIIHMMYNIQEGFVYFHKPSGTSGFPNPCVCSRYV